MKPLTTILVVLALLSATVTHVFSESRMLTNTGSISGVVTHSLTSELVEDAVVQIYAGDEYCYFVPQILDNELKSGMSNIECATALPMEPGVVTGIVTDSITSDPIPGALVGIVGAGFAVSTDENGEYVIEDSPIGIFDFWAEADGYEPGLVPEVEVEAGDTTIVDFELSPIPPELISANPGMHSVTLSWEAIGANGGDYFPVVGCNCACNIWTIYFYQATINGIDMVEGDEIAIFDGALMVGSMDLESICTPENQFENDLIAWDELNSGDGYTPGNAATFKAWDQSTATPVGAYNISFSNPYGDAWMEATFPFGDGEYSIVGLDFVSDNYPQFNIYYEDGTLVDGPVEGTIYTDNGLEPGEEYCYYVTQMLENGEESYPSNVLCATPTTYPAYLYGYVYNIETNEPISGAIVDIGFGLTDTTDQNGNFDFGSIPAGMYSLMVTKFGYISPELPMYFQIDGGETVEIYIPMMLIGPGLVTVEPSSNGIELLWEPIPGSDRADHILDIAFTTLSYEPTFNIYSLDQGLVAEGVTGNSYIDSLDVVPGVEYCYFVTQLLPDGQESDSSNVMCAVLPQYGEITGYVMDSITGEPLEGLTVTLEEGGYTSVTGADGSFSFEDLEPGTYEVCTGGGCYFYECQTVELEAGETVEVIFNLVPIPIPGIEAIVTGWDLSIEIDIEIPEYINETLEGFYIYRDGELITEEPVGDMFYIEEHPAGEFTYTATAIFDNSESCPSDEVIVNVEPVLYGEISHQANGEPIGGAMVTCNGDTTLTDENGEYHLSAGYGTHTCKVEYEGCNTVEEEISFNDHFEWNVGMTEPVMQVEPDELYFEAPCVPGPEPLYISNEGNGPLYWSISVIYEEEEGWLMVPGGNSQVGPGETETLLIYATIEGLENQTYHAQLIIHPYPNVGADTVDVTLDITIGLDELPGERINLYPNPTNGKLNVEVSREIKRFSLISAIGQKIREVSMNETDKKVMDVSAYEPGIYIIKFFTEEEVIISRKVIIE